MLLDRLLDRHVALAQVAAGKGMATHEQDQEDHHRQAEIVVVLAPDHAGQRAVLQLRRGEDRHPDIAREASAPGRDLEKIAIDQPHPRIGADQDGAVIDVGDDGALGMHRAKARATLAETRTRKRQSARGKAVRRLFGL